MATPKSINYRIIRWQGAQHPTASTIAKLMKNDSLIPYEWEASPNQRYATRSHNTRKILYVIEGTLDVQLPDDNLIVKLKIGDRIELNASVRYGLTAGSTTTKCIEATLK